MCLDMDNKKQYQKYKKKILRIKNNQIRGGNLFFYDWFECAFGFNERPYKETQKKLKKMFDKSNGLYLNNIKIGDLRLLSNSDLHSLLKSNTDIGKHITGSLFHYPEMKHPGKVVLKNIIADIKDIHRNKDLSNNATIQVASQLNCLEMVNPNITPEDGITIYKNDNTQGPICAMCAPAGLAYRNYLYNGGQTKENQINLALEFLNFIKKYDNTINWDIKNGYLFFDNNEQLRKINRVLSKDHSIRKEARQLIKSGFHIRQEVFIDCKSYGHNVNHVYCSGLPINYNKLSYHLWLGISELFLEAMYENTLLCACINNKKNSANNPCYLTHIGGGVFGMSHSQIKRAIQRACNIIAKNGFNLDVKIVNYKTVNHIYETIPKSYPIFTDIKSDSIWEDVEWIKIAK
jgi:hypothetical protein